MTAPTPAPGQAAHEGDAPLTHFFHCWRFPDHHACAVALIERQQEENDRLLVRAPAIAAQEPHAAPDLELAKIATERNQYRMALEKISGGEVGNGIAALRKIAVRTLEQYPQPAAGNPASLAPGEGGLAAARLLTAHAHEAIAAAIGREEAAEAKVAEAREGIGNFLAEYGDSEIPMFKVAQDLANSIRKILSDEEAPGA